MRRGQQRRRGRAGRLRQGVVRDQPVPADRLPGPSLVLRTVIVTSYSFTLLATRADEGWPCPEFERWAGAFAAAYPDARPITLDASRVTVPTGADHFATSLYPAVAHYPSRYTEEPNPYVEGVLKGKLGGFTAHVPRGLIEAGNTEHVAETLRDMVSSCEKGLAFGGRVCVPADGFDHDPPGIWEFPKAREFFRRLFLQRPFVMFPSHPGGAPLRLLAACSPDRRRCSRGR